VLMAPEALQGKDFSPGQMSLGKVSLKESPLSLLQWSSHKVRRVCRSTLSASNTDLGGSPSVAGNGNATMGPHQKVRWNLNLI
jgi:hypothetical protein